METPFLLLRYVARALVSLVPGGGLATDLITDLLPTVAQDIFRQWKAARDARQMRQDMEAIAQATGEEVRCAVEGIVAEEGARLSDGERADLEAYLRQVPAAVSRTLRRPDDPAGRTVPAHLVPRDPNDVLRWLPDRLPRFQPGQRPAGCGDLELVRLLGAGGFGEVWLARNPYLTNRPPVALKFCLDAASARELRREASLLDRVMRDGRHPGIVELKQTHFGAEVPCLEYEYVDGGELGGVIREWHAREGGPSPKEAARVVLRVAEIMAYAHGLTPPIVHRDLKPANILVQAGAGDEGGRLKIADFGIGGLAARQVIAETMAGRTRPAEALSRALHGSHTPLYASPQQERGHEPDPRDDVHALGVIWYQILTGDLGKGSPRGGQWKRRLKQDRGVPAAHLDVLERCIEEEPEDRLADAGALVAALEPLLGGREVSAPASAPSAPPSSPQVTVTAAPTLLRREAGETRTGPHGIELVWCPPGTFTMGEGSEAHEVTLTRGFWIGKTLVTQAQWEKVMGRNPSHFNGPQNPVEQVSRDDADAFLAKLGQGYRLPTEAEWEYACRAGSATTYCFGDDEGRLGDYAWFAANSGGTTHPVGRKKPNAWGIHDMHGNVWEWCREAYPNQPVTDPVGAAQGAARVIRGGSWNRDAGFCRAALRSRLTPSYRNFNLGFRPAVSPP